MNLHEYQAKQLFREYGLPVPAGVVLSQQDDWDTVFNSLENEHYIVKAQIHAGGRGKAGGIVWAKSRQELDRACRNLLGSSLITKQTGPEGLPVKHLLIEQPVEIVSEYYLGVTIDRAQRSILVIASSAGGMNIEEAAIRSPDSIIRQLVSLGMGIKPYQCRRLAVGLGLDVDVGKQFCEVLRNAYSLFVATDASLVEVNPLVLTSDGRLVCLDAKVSLDENAGFRHADRDAMRDPSQISAIEVEASAHHLSYVKLHGNIGCIVNGAGLAMATMDLITLHGGAPANFLDVGGDTDARRVAVALKLLMSDPDVQGIFVNIFGGIVRCDVIAQGILDALAEIEFSVPMVVLLQGTNAQAGKHLLQDKHPRIEPADQLEQAAATIIQMANAA